ncbi:MAG: hypothetical protein CME32_03660 [Gimesia sp.]|nr:hypothetical protein [Gimesia sp.]
MKSSCHRLEYYEASEREIITAARSWWQMHGFTVHAPEHPAVLISHHGSDFGITDRQTKRIMQVLLQPTGTGTAVSVNHHTSRIFCLVGVMCGNILEQETDSFLHFIGETIATSY